MSADVAAADIAEALQIDKRSARRRAAEEGWFFNERAGAGGRRRLYPVGLLPPAIRDRVLIHLANRETVAQSQVEVARATLGAEFAEAGDASAQEGGLSSFAALPEGRRRAAEIKAELVGYFAQYVERSGLPRYRALALFIRQYNDGILEVPDSTREAWRVLSARSIERWEAQLAKGGLARLAGKYGTRKGNGTIDANGALRDFILGMLVEHPHVSAKLVMRGIRARFAPEAQPKYRTVQRWLNAWKRDNKQLFAAVTNPDAWRSKYKAAGGSASASIVRLNQRWEIDGTKGDLILADNRRHTLTAFIDVYSRRALIHVSRSSSAAAVASGLRRAILTWGVPEQIGSDNGSDFVSHHVKRVIAGLGIEHDIAPPYTPEHKPFVERFFGTFTNDLVELLPGFVGANVTERKAIEARRSFAQRMMKQGGEKIELRMTAEELQAFCDSWTDTVYARDPHSGLGGKTPFEVAAAWRVPPKRIENERALDVLLSPAPDGNGIRTVTKKGIRLDNAYFDASELGGLEGSEVRVLLDDADIGQIYVFAIDGPFIAKAICPERANLGVTRQELASRRQAHQRHVMSEQKAELRAAAKSANTGTILDDILRGRAGEAEKVVAFPAPSVSHTTADLDEAALAIRPPAWRDHQEASEALLAMEAKIAADLANPATRSAEDDKYVALIETERSKPANVVKLVETDIDRFKRTLVLTALLNEGKTIPEADRQWMNGYTNTSEYKGRLSLYLEWGVKALEQ